MRYKMVMVGAAMALLAGPTLADPKDYRFEPVSDQIEVSPSTPVAVRLIHIPSNKPVTGAIIFQSRLEMPMTNMPPMATRISARPGDGAGVYPFVADVSMAGPWVLVLAAKVPGETANVTASIPLTAAAAGHSHNH
jgi:hypothetical protein